MWAYMAVSLDVSGMFRSMLFSKHPKLVMVMAATERREGLGVEANMRSDMQRNPNDLFGGMKKQDTHPRSKIIAAIPIITCSVMFSACLADQS